MCPPEHDHTVATKRSRALQRTPEQEASAGDGDASSQALAQLRQTTGNAGLLLLLTRRQESPSVQRDGQDAAAREAGRKERAARREALAARREKLDARKQAREARLAGGQAPAAPPGPGPVAGPQVAAGPVAAAGAPAAGGPAQAPAGGAAESMAAKLAKWAELQNKRQADIAATTPAAKLGPAAPGPAPAASAPKTVNTPDHKMAASQLSELGSRLRNVAQPVTDQRIYSGATDKKTFQLFRESNLLSSELARMVSDYRGGYTTDAEFQAQRATWLTKLGAYEQKVLAYKPPAKTYRPQGHESAIEITEAGQARQKREGRWAERMDRRGS